MTEAPTEENLDESHKEYDNLKKIDYIGDAREKWFRKSFGIRTYEDLATLSADEIESRLKADGQIVSRGRIEQWIADAQERATAAKLASSQMVETVEAENPKKANAPVELGEWRSFAAFVVDFQAREVRGGAEEQQIEVTHMTVGEDGTWLENGGQKKEVVIGEELYKWMLAQLGEAVQPEPEAEDKPSAEIPPFGPPRAMTPQVNLRITRIQIFQPPEAETATVVAEAGQPLLGVLSSGEPFSLEASIQLSPAAAADATEGLIAHYAQFYARNLSTGVTRHLGDTTPRVLVRGESVYRSLLPEATLESGTYRLQVLARLDSTPPVVRYLEVPFLQVVQVPISPSNPRSPDAQVTHSEPTTTRTGRHMHRSPSLALEGSLQLTQQPDPN